jgi:hypothetical protein
MSVCLLWWKDSGPQLYAEHIIFSFMSFFVTCYILMNSAISKTINIFDVYLIYGWHFHLLAFSSTFLNHVLVMFIDSSFSSPSSLLLLFSLSGEARQSALVSFD